MRNGSRVTPRKACYNRATGERARCGYRASEELERYSWKRKSYRAPARPRHRLVGYAGDVAEWLASSVTFETIGAQGHVGGWAGEALFFGN
jgi:hypothetical protein